MSHIGEFELIGRISAACHSGDASHSEASLCHSEAPLCHSEDSCHIGVSGHSEAPLCHSEAPLCYSEAPLCHSERSEESSVIGIGDDCAVIPQHTGLDTLVTTDLLIEGRHFLLEDVTPYDLGWKSAAVNISDIAAMGGRPTAAFLSIAIPKDLPRHSRPDRESPDPSSCHPDPPLCHPEPSSCHPEPSSCHPEPSSCHPERSEGSPSPLTEWMDWFIAGFNALCGKYGVRLLGGDTSASDDKLFINVTLLGECPHGGAVLRSGALPGDVIYVTGPLGDSAAGLKLILERTSVLPGRPAPDPAVPGPDPAVPGPDPAVPGLDPAVPGPDPAVPGPDPAVPGPDLDQILIQRHYLPEPRVEMGQQLAALPGVHSMMDISDGIASDLNHILEESSRHPDPSCHPEPASCHPERSEGSPDPSRHSRPDRESLSAEIDIQSIPTSKELKALCAARGWDPVELAVSGGEDYELLFTAAPECKVPEGCVAIGRIVPATGGIRWIGTNKEFKGFTHF